MTTKEMAIQSLEHLPADATWDDVRDRINFVAGVRKAVQELDAGQGIPHNVMKDNFAPWLGK